MQVVSALGKRVLRALLAGVLGAAAPLTGQAPLKPTSWHEVAGTAASQLAIVRPLMLAQATPPKQSTFLERLGFGALMGGLLALAATELASEDYDVAAGLTGLAVGSAGGVILVGLKREGAEPLGAIAGAGLSTGLIVLIASLLPEHPEGPSAEQLILGVGMVLMPPIGAAVGHGIACETCRRHPSGRGPPF